jgi:MFS family permease
VSLVNKIQHVRFPARRDITWHRKSSALGRLRVALCAVFAVHGFIYASWAVRVPAVKEQTGASPAALGLALLGLSGGAVATMLIAGALCRRFGSPRITVISCALLSTTLVLPALAHSAITLGLMLAVFGAAYGCLNVAMNSVAVEIVAALRRPVMPGFHAAWSFGGLAGAGIGGLLAPHLSPLKHLSLIALAGLLVAAVTGRTLLAGVPSGPRDPAIASGRPVPPGRPAAADPGGWRRTLRTGRVVGLFGLIALCAAYDEGAIGDWGALHLRQDLGAGAGLAAAGYAAFALAEATGRLSGTTLLERLGRTPVLVLGGLTACAGMLVASLAPDVWLALAGFAATGLGLANLFPVAIARAGLRAGADGVALTSTLGYSGFLLGPPAIGFLATEFGLRAGLTTLSFLALAAAAVAYLCRDELDLDELGPDELGPDELGEHVHGEERFCARDALLAGPAVGHGQQAADAACDGVLGERRVGELTKFLQAGLAVCHPQLACHRQVLRRVLAEDLEGALDSRACRHRGARAAAQVGVIEVRQPVGGGPDLTAHPPFLPGQHGLVRAEPGQHGADRLAVPDHHAVHAAHVARLGVHLQPTRRADQGEGRL